MVTVSCKIVRVLKELLPKKPDNGQVEMFPIILEDRRLRFLVFQFVKDNWTIDVAE